MYNSLNGYVNHLIHFTTQHKFSQYRIKFTKAAQLVPVSVNCLGWGMVAMGVGTQGRGTRGADTGNYSTVDCVLPGDFVLKKIFFIFKTKRRKKEKTSMIYSVICL